MTEGFQRAFVISTPSGLPRGPWADAPLPLRPFRKASARSDNTCPGSAVSLWWKRIPGFPR